MQKVAVIFGGKSCENEISVLTGVFVLNLLGRDRYDVFPVYIHTDGKWYTSDKAYNLDLFKKADFSLFSRVFLEDGCLYELCEKKGKGRVRRLAKLDCVLNCCHGGLGEGGGVSAVAELNGVPLASPSLLSSSVFLDKAMTKFIARALSIPTVDYVCAKESDYKKRGKFLLKNVESKLKYPVVIKPSRLGSSIGIAIAKDEEELKRALEVAFLLDEKVVVEKYLEEKKDVNCAAYSLRGEVYVSDAEVACDEKGIYTFADKYLKKPSSPTGTKLQEQDGQGLKKPELDEEITKKIKAYTKSIYRKMDVKGVIRIDYLVKGKEIYLSEVNTVPGSLAYYLFCSSLTSARQFFCDLIDDAIATYFEKSVLQTGILQKVRLNGKVRL